MRPFPALVLLLVCLFAAWLSPARADAPKVLVLPMHGTLTDGRAGWTITQIHAAWKQGMAGVILDFDSDGGSSDAARQLKTAILTEQNALPIAAYVHDRALGASALPALACKPLAFAPGGTLGAAGEGATGADLQAAAQANGRNPAVAAAFVAAAHSLPSLAVRPGDALTLTAGDAQRVGYADVVAADTPGVLAKMGLTNAQIVTREPSGWELACLWIVQPWATALLLILGLALVIAEVLTWHSWGIAGAIGGGVVLLIFAAHLTLGAGAWVGVFLFLGGVTLLVFETHVFPGHGLAAFAGLILIFLGLFYALGGPGTGALMTAAMSLFATLGILGGFLTYLPRSPIWKKLGQPMRQTAAQGYVSSENYTDLLGTVGEAATALRPSGTAEIAGRRLPVVTEGDFLEEGTAVQVVLVQGGRIVVREASSLG